MDAGRGKFFGQLNPPFIPAFLLVVPPHKKSSTQVGLRQILRIKRIEKQIIQQLKNDIGNGGVKKF
ncbi:hypothetical protein AR438_15540 [Chryseobacterium aquaticum]|uniref:Uncharacterized protein n=2 Tax=Chryseobacterium aquaticum TaxID=452084 RepID=A0A101CEY4_9FLAO|nr:hypothetical protein AR438_15540 [Chryseobacterium aquaticum]KUJ55026.1 hypothetical protein AR686_15865 [Chryseobacterium aquaticum subsp. greenlandense]